MTYWFFGQPGSGKTYVATLFSSMSGIPLIEADDFHTPEDRKAVAAGTFTRARRHAQLRRIRMHIRKEGIADAVITHPLPDRTSRELLSGADSVFIHVHTPPALHLRRLRRRTGHHFTADLLQAWQARHWEEPSAGDCLKVLNMGPKSGIRRQLVHVLEGSQKNTGRGKK